MEFYPRPNWGSLPNPMTPSCFWSGGEGRRKRKTDRGQGNCCDTGWEKISAGLSKRVALAGFGCNGERAYNGGLRQSPQRGFRDEASLKLNAFSVLHVQRKPQICTITDIGQWAVI